MHTEAAQTEASSYTNAAAVSEPVAAFSSKKRSGAGNQAAQEYFMPPSDNGSPAAQLLSPPQGVSNCYVFKSRLQEYAQKKGLATPVYETIKEGPSHEPSFRSTVILKDVRYDSLPGFFNRKAAEQSAAEVALTELAKSDGVKCISQPVHETGLCKNLLQEYAQKMNYAIPLYQFQKDETPSRATNFKCTVEIGGIQYIGASARTKREAEIKAARTALLAIQSSTSESHISLGNSQLTVIPFRKRGAETVTGSVEAVIVPKAKKARFKKKMPKKKLSKMKAKNNQSKQAGKVDVIADRHTRSESDQTCASSVVQAMGKALLPVSAVVSLQDGSIVSELCSKETTNDVIGTENQNVATDSEKRSSSNFIQSLHGMSTGISSESNEDATKVSGVALTEVGSSTVMAVLNPLADRAGQI
ncbi:double-stranded RNA-binding protein 1 isoform X2 [Euphorbia lathyris]